MLISTLSVMWLSAAPAPTVPTLVNLELGNGMPRQPVERAVKMALEKLDRCLAFVAAPEKLDARVQVTVTVAGEAKAQAALSDANCVASTVNEMILEAALLEAMSAVRHAGANLTATAFKFSYDYRPSESQRKTHAARLRKSYDLLCRTFNERGYRDPVGTYSGLQRQLEPRWADALRPMVELIRSQNPPNAWPLFAAAVRDVAKSVGIDTPCGVFAP
jgi:hypothetical protein